MTLLDYPGKVACTVFLQGCNFRCPFCHNRDLLDIAGQGSIDKEDLLSFLKKRQGLLDGVCITGGEPTLQSDLKELLRSIKELGYCVKLDTNGYRPEILKELVADGLVDYVAMDIKNCPDRYAETAGLPQINLDRIEESIRFLLSGAVEFEFRTTVVEELHNEHTMEKIGLWLQRIDPVQKAQNFFLQPYTDRETVLCGGLHTPASEELRRFEAALRPYVQKAVIRGAAL